MRECHYTSYLDTVTFQCLPCPKTTGTGAQYNTYCQSCQLLARSCALTDKKSYYDCYVAKQLCTAEQLSAAIPQMPALKDLEYLDSNGSVMTYRADGSVKEVTADGTETDTDA